MLDNALRSGEARPRVKKMHEAGFIAGVLFVFFCASISNDYIILFAIQNALLHAFAGPFIELSFISFWTRNSSSPLILFIASHVVFYKALYRFFFSSFYTKKIIALSSILFFCGSQILFFVITAVILKHYYQIHLDFSVLANALAMYLSVLIITILVLLELLYLAFRYLEAKKISGSCAETKKNKRQSETQTAAYSAIRPAIFLFLFGIDISMSFLPLHMENLYEPMWGLSKEFVMGLPISVEFFFVGIAVLAAGVWFDRNGWYEPFFYGLLIAVCGGLFSWLAPDALSFIIARGIVGIGYGFVLMASQGFVIANTDNSNKARGMAYLAAGVYAGSICGGAIGGILAEYIGYSPVFLCGAAIQLLVVIYLFVFMRTAIAKSAKQSRIKATASISLKQWLCFLRNRGALALLLFGSLPASIVVVGLLNYFCPVYLSSIGASESVIGRILMIYGICLIYLAPAVGKYVDAAAARNKKHFVLAGCVTGSLALLTFYALNGVAAVVVAILLLGLSDSLIVGSHSAYALRLRVTKQLGPGRAVSLLDASGRLGQVLGPLLFASVVFVGNADQSVAFIGLFYLLAAGLFLLFTRKDERILAPETA